MCRNTILFDKTNLRMVFKDSQKKNKVHYAFAIQNQCIIY